MILAERILKDVQADGPGQGATFTVGHLRLPRAVTGPGIGQSPCMRA